MSIGKVHKTFLVASMLIFAMSQANAELSVLSEKGEGVAITPYLSAINMPETLDDKSMQKAQMLDSAVSQKDTVGQAPDINHLFYPAKSYFTQGFVEKHKLTGSQTKQITFFLIGDDDVSLSWAKKNAKFFSQINAMGFITNVSCKEKKEEIEDAVHLKLNIVSLEGLEKVVGTSNYPFLVYKGWVVQ